jgi:hypothetical protein
VSSACPPIGVVVAFNNIILSDRERIEQKIMAPSYELFPNKKTIPIPQRKSTRKSYRIKAAICRMYIYYKLWIS